ncbi:hypothetical protein CORC01_06793 [Colletotrichum orchidophilum]|uniref:Uncharacterized protein n=1 Tax=Colletotrichum orchidophilum TaxID=1209926 RepID=A0A1G4B942_9PEZI|nr:uncharacterized protein CORC01_06793 [Colletotrichum orchidophilum]OHE97930.1 hypothetical protein CORC01_06793 [Colletotrichum orchidophilum]
MQIKFFLATVFASMVLATPAIKQLSSLDHPKLVGRPKGATTPSGGSCCSSLEGLCSSDCVSDE